MTRSLRHFPLMSLGRFNQTQETCYFNLTLPKIIIGIKGFFSKFWVRITGLKNAIRDTLRHEAMIFFIYQGNQTNRNTLSCIKIKHFPRRTDKPKYLFIASRYNKYTVHHSTDVKLWQFRWRKLAFRKMTRLN